MKRLFILLFMLVPMFLSAQDLTLKKHPKKDLWGYWGVKSNGKENFIIKPQFEQAGSFVKGQAFVCKKGKWSIIDNSGKVVLQTTYTKVDVSSPNKSHFRVWNSDKCGMFDVAALREVLDVKYTKIEVWQSNLYKLHIDNYQGLANFAGRTILPVKYSGISVWLGGGYLLKLNGRCGLANDKGEVILPVKYSEIKASKHGGYLVKANDKYGLVSTAGKEILPVSYDEIIALKGDKFMLKSNGNYSLTDAMGRRYSAKIHKVADNLCAFCVDEWVFVDDAGNPVDVSDRALFYTTNDGNKLDVSLGSAKHLFSRGYGVVLFDTPPTVIGERAFEGCTTLTSVKLPNGVTKIDSGIFANCSALTSINIPDCVTKIESHAFKGCSALTSINIPNSVTEIEWYVFSNCSALTNINLPDGIAKIDSGTFENCSALTSINIPNSVTEIGNTAFEDCTSLRSITLPNGVTSIEWRTFGNCRSLTSVTIPNCVTKIGRSAFEDCTSLKRVAIGNSITEIGEYAFCNCSSLTSITIPNSVTTIGEGVFQNCTKLSAFYGKFATSDKRCLIVNGELVGFAGAGVKSYAIPNGVKVIGSGAFAGCSELASVKIPKSVTEVESADAFEGCTSLPVVGGLRYADNCLVAVVDDTLPIHRIRPGTRIIPNGVLGLAGVRRVIVPESVTLIGDNAFYDSYLVSIEFQGSLCVTSFPACLDLKRVTHRGVPVEFSIGWK